MVSHNIIPLAQVSRQAIKDMAKSAVDNGLPITENPFTPGSLNHAYFNQDFHAHDLELVDVD